MPTDLRFVFDINVIVSALLLKHSVARQVLDKALEQVTGLAGGGRRIERSLTAQRV